MGEKAALAPEWESIKHKFIGGPYAGAEGMAAGGGSVGVEAFADDAEAIKAIRLFPSVMRRYGGLDPSSASDNDIAAKFLPALKVMLPHGGYFHDTLYGIKVVDENTFTSTTGDMQLKAPRVKGEWGAVSKQQARPVKTTMRVLPDKVEMDLHGVEKWAWVKPNNKKANAGREL
jgi:hypothetical protein